MSKARMTRTFSRKSSLSRSRYRKTVPGDIEPNTERLTPTLTQPQKEPERDINTTSIRSSDGDFKPVMKREPTTPKNQERKKFLLIGSGLESWNASEVPITREANVLGCLAKIIPKRSRTAIKLILLYHTEMATITSQPFATG